VIPEPCDCLLESCFEVILRCIPERCLCPGDVGEGVPHVAWAGRFVDRLDLLAHDLHDGAGERQEVDPLPAGDVEGALCLALHRFYIGLDDVFDVGEVAGLSSVAVDDRRPAGQDLLHEVRDDGGVLGVRVLVRAENIEVPEADGLEAVEVGED